MSGWLIRTLGLLLLALAAAVAAFKAPDRPLEWLVGRWGAPPSEFIELRLDGGLQLVHLRQEGPRHDPLPLLLLHGTADSLHTWDGWTRELAKTRRVIRVDLPGFGLTGPAQSGDYAIDAYVRFVQVLLDHLKLPRVLLVGNSLGGEVAWLTAAAHPERVAGLVLIDPAGLRFEPQKLPLLLAANASPTLSWLGRYLLPRPLVRSSVEAVFGDPSRVRAADTDRFFDMALRAGNREALHERLRHFMLERDTDRHAQAWPKVHAPTLLLWGEKDRLIPPSTAQRYLQLRAPASPTPELVLLPGLGHVPQLEDPAASLAAAQAFIDRIR